MYQEERLIKILDYLNQNQSMSVNDICDRLQVSRDTARRDIIKLVDQGAAIRTRGGIALPEIRDTIRAYRERLETYSDEKMCIGQRAESLLQPHGHYFLDTSTTVSCLARQIDEPVSVFTHSLDIAEILSDQEKQANVYLFGGSLNKNNRYFFDAEYLSLVEKIRFDAAFLGAAAIMNDGIYFDDKDDALMKRLAASRSRQTVVLADSEKFSRTSRYRGLEWGETDVIVTNKQPPESFARLCRIHQIQIILCHARK